MKTIVLFIVLSLYSVNFYCQLTVNTLQATANQLVDQLVGSGVTWSNASFTGSYNGSAASNRGFFSNGSSVIGINNGIILSTGNVLAATQTNQWDDYSYINALTGDATLNTISSPTYDAAVLQFDFVPESNYIEFKYVFASEEYPEYVGDIYNDVFAFFVTSLDADGYNYNNQNIALIPGTSTPVTINNVNAGSYSTYYINYDYLNAPFEYDGLTRVLTAKCNVTPCKRYRMKIAIADVGDYIYDSAVMLEANSFSSPVVDNVGVTYSNPAVGGGTQMVEGCSNGIITLNLSTSTPIARTVPIILGGTATYGTDYTISPGWFTAPNIWNVTVPAGQSSVTLTITPSMDGVNEGTETISLQIQSNMCSPYTYISGSTNILDDAMSFTFSSVSNPAGTVITNPADGTAWGRTGGTITFRNASWPTCINWGLNATLTNAVNTTSLTFDAGNANTDLANGNICFTGTTNTITYLNSSGSYVSDPINIRLRIQLRAYPGGAAIPVERIDYSGNTYLLIKARDFDATLYYEAYGPSNAIWGTNSNGNNYANTWAGLINVFDALHTNGATFGATLNTNFNYSFYNIDAGAVVSSNSPVCIGNPINLYANIGTCRTMHYSWTGPNSFTSNVQNPVINNAVGSMAGTYNVVAYDRICYGTGNTNVSISTPPTTGLINTDYLWTGRVSSEWNNSSNWVAYNGSNFILPASVPASSNNVFLKPFNSCVANDPIISTANGNCKKITIESPISLTITNNQTLNVYGDWVNNSIVTNVLGTTVRFLGSTRQYIQGTASTSFANVQINNTGGGIVADRDFNILETLSMTLGHLDLKDHIVDLSTTGSVSGENENSRIRATNSSWADGAGSGYIIALRNNPSGNVAGLGLDFTPSVALGNNINIRRGCQALQGSGGYMSNYSIFRYYAIYPIPVASGININVNSFKYWGGGSNPELNGHTESDLKMFQQVQYWNGNTNPIYWEPRNTSVFVGGDYVTSTTTSNPMMLDYILITLASNTNPLPVELINFKGICDSLGIYLYWQTASEVNNYGFYLEKSIDAEHWSTVTFIPGNGNSNAIINYSASDFNPSSNNNYYRLKQIDYDGVVTYSHIITVSCNQNSFNQEDITPIYFDNGDIEFELLGLVEKEYNLQIVNVLGQPIANKTIKLQSKSQFIKFDLNFASGVYYISMNTSNEVITKSFVITK